MPPIKRDGTPRNGGRRIPGWLRRPLAERIGRGPARRATAAIHTVCEEARCPNRGVCLGEDNTATFLLMGPGCSRDCGFCAVAAGPAPVDKNEPAKVARAAAALALDYVVLTSTTRDDIADGGAGHFAATVRATNELLPGAAVEVLAPDFGGAPGGVELLAAAPVAVFGHNLETVPRLYASIRPGADFRRSLDVLARARAAGAITKTALLVGLGEDEGEVLETLKAARAAAVDIVAVGQYLRPGVGQRPVVRYWEPTAFVVLAAAIRRLGFAAVAAGAYVRSSYRAAALYREALSARVP